MSNCSLSITVRTASNRFLPIPRFLAYRLLLIWSDTMIKLDLPLRGILRHLLAGLPCFRYLLFCLVHTAGFQFETSLVQRSSSCLAIIFACLQLALSENIHDVIPHGAKRSSAFCFALVMQSTHSFSSSSGLILSKEGLLSASWLLSLCSLRSWLLCSVVSCPCSLSGSWGSTSAVTSTLAA